MARSLLMNVPLNGSVTKVRTVAVIAVALMSVPAAMHGTDATGVTVLTLFGRLTAPAVADTFSTYAFTCSPAPYGLMELSTASACMRVRPVDLVIGLTGLVGGGWSDLSMSASQRWMISSSFVVGTALRVNWSGARGFQSTVGAAATVHVLADLDDQWTIAGGIDELLSLGTWQERTAGSFRMGVGWKGPVHASANLRITPTRTTSLELVGVSSPVEPLLIMGGIETDPMMVMIGARLHAAPIWPVTIVLRYSLDLGLRTQLTVEVP